MSYRVQDGVAILETSEFQIQVATFDGMVTLAWRKGLYTDEIKRRVYRALSERVSEPGRLVTITEKGISEMAEIVRKMLADKSGEGG